MKKGFVTTGLVITIVTTLMSCAATVHVERDQTADLSQYKTYQWVETRTNQNDNSSITAFGDEAIHTAVQQELSQRGWREVTENPDVLITHDVLVERTTTQQSDPVYTQPFTRAFYNPYARRWGTLYYPSRFIGYDTYTVPVREGTITLTVLDAKTDKTI
jgi:hypothetical protein